MHNAKKSVLVTGGTGQQGGAVVNALLASMGTDIHICALTRNADSQPARALARRGVELRQGDLRDAASVSEALRGVDFAYLVTDFRGVEGVEGEVMQGKQFIEMAKCAGQYKVYLLSIPWLI